MINTVDSEFIVNNEGIRFNIDETINDRIPIKRISLDDLSVKISQFKESLKNKATIVPKSINKPVVIYK